MEQFGLAGIFLPFTARHQHYHQPSLPPKAAGPSFGNGPALATPPPPSRPDRVPDRKSWRRGGEIFPTDRRWRRILGPRREREQHRHDQNSHDDERADETRSRHVYAGKLLCVLPTTLAFPEERGESVRVTPTPAATRESAGGKTKRHRSRDAVGIREHPW